MSTDEWSRTRLLVALLVAVQLVAVLLMWILNPVGQRSQASFALLLAADLVAFSIISYIVRLRSMGWGYRGGFVLFGSGLVLLLVVLAMVQ